MEQKLPILPKKGNFFHDFDENKAFNGILAIEPELGSDYFFKHRSLDTQKPCEDTRRSVFKDEFSSLKDKNGDKIKLKYHNESSHITEIDNLHLLCDEDRNRLIKSFTEAYKNKFTLGRCNKPSGGVHFHTFSALHADVSLPIFRGLGNDTLVQNTLNAPLFCVPDKGHLYARYSGNRMGQPGNSQKTLETRRRLGNIGHDSTGLVYTKNDYLPGLEHRANNVFDIRLYGYYCGIVLLGLLKIELENPFLDKDDMNRFNLASGNDYDRIFHSKSDDLGRISPSEFYEKTNGFSINDKTKFSLPLFKRNVGKLYFILLINDMPKAKAVLEEYVLEQFKLKCPVVKFDCTTGVITKKTSGYIAKVHGVTAFFKDKLSIRAIYRMYVPEMFSTVSSGALQLITNSVEKINILPLKDLLGAKSKNSKNKT